MIAASCNHSGHEVQENNALRHCHIFKRCRWEWKGTSTFTLTPHPQIYRPKTLQHADCLKVKCVEHQLVWYKVERSKALRSNAQILGPEWFFQALNLVLALAKLLQQLSMLVIGPDNIWAGVTQTCMNYLRVEVPPAVIIGVVFLFFSSPGLAILI
jgi:hypothetical protein